MSTNDISLMVREGITGVLNVQTKYDMAHKEVDWEIMTSYYA